MKTLGILHEIGLDPWLVSTGEHSEKSEQMFVALARRMYSALKEHDVVNMLKQQLNV
jgi:hypothetical protein